MSVLIRGMEMPQGNSTINVLIYADGTIYTGHVNDSRYSAVSVPAPHGRLIDADAFKETIDYYIRETNWSDAHNEALGWAKEFIDNEQAVIEAEGET